MGPSTGDRARGPITLSSARKLLGCFDVADDPLTKAFLADVLVSGVVPREEVDLLRRLSVLPAGDGGGSAQPRGIGTDNHVEGAKKGSRRGQKRQGRRANKQRASKAKEVDASPFFEHSVDDSSQGDDSGLLSSSERMPCVRASARLVAVFTTTTVLNAQPGSDSQKKGESVVSSQHDPSILYNEEEVFSNDANTSANGNPAIHCTPRASAGVFKSPPPSSRRTSPSEAAAPAAAKSEPEPPCSPFSPVSPEASPGPSPFDEAKYTPRGRKGEMTSHFFTSPSQTKEKRKPDSKSTPKRAARGAVSSLPFAPLTADRFGLVQEELAGEPFWLLVALVFLVRVAGRTSLPVFWRIKAAYPTPEALADASPRTLVSMMRPLGMSSVRCATIQRYAREWLERPPRAGVCSTVKKYPQLPEAEAGAVAGDSEWEIGHLTQGAYFVDSWRIFCRDSLLGLSTDWQGRGCCGHAECGNGNGNGNGNDADSCGCGSFQPEWMRVLPRDKELRACLRWMWMKEGWNWNPLTGDRSVLQEELRCAVDEGRVGYDANGQLQILDVSKDVFIRTSTVSRFDTGII